MAILNRFSAILLYSVQVYCDSTFFLLLAAEFLAIPGPRFWESCHARFAILCHQGPQVDLNGLSCHIHPQSSVELCRSIALHESIKLSNRGRENCPLDLVGLIVNQ